MSPWQATAAAAAAAGKVLDAGVGACLGPAPLRRPLVRSAAAQSLSLSHPSNGHSRRKSHTGRRLRRETAGGLSGRVRAASVAAAASASASGSASACARAEAAAFKISPERRSWKGVAGRDDLHGHTHRSACAGEAAGAPTAASSVLSAMPGSQPQGQRTYTSPSLWPPLSVASLTARCTLPQPPSQPLPSQPLPSQPLPFQPLPFQPLSHQEQRTCEWTGQLAATTAEAVAEAAAAVAMRAAEGQVPEGGGKWRWPWARAGGWPESPCREALGRGLGPEIHALATATAAQRTRSVSVSRRGLLLLSALGTGSLVGAGLLGPPAASAAAVAAEEAAAATAVSPAEIDLSVAPSAAFDPTDERLRQAAVLFEQALGAQSVEEEERLWSAVVDAAESSGDAAWVPDILSRAYGNRGNARSRQGRLDEALSDYNRSIKLAPYAVDPVLNRGVALESLGRYAEAEADYRAVLAAAPDDPAAWNNLGNVMAAEGKWDEAVADYKRAADLAPSFSFAAANYALALYQTGSNDNIAVKQMRTLLRKYPEFPDMRAALAVALYALGKVGEAETNWGRVEDTRYRDRVWVKDVRRWPPRLVAELTAFLDLS